MASFKLFLLNKIESQVLKYEQLNKILFVIWILSLKINEILPKD